MIITRTKRRVKLKLGLDLFNRFWSSKAVFNDNAIGHVVFDNGEPIAICYSCAQMGSYAEIDVFTLPNYRRKGAAMLAGLQRMLPPTLVLSSLW